MITRRYRTAEESVTVRSAAVAAACGAREHEQEAAGKEEPRRNPHSSDWAAIVDLWHEEEGTHEEAAASEHRCVGLHERVHHLPAAVGAIGAGGRAVDGIDAVHEACQYEQQAAMRSGAQR
eukprot:1054027-Prymnesium_polylepis.1